MHEFYVFSQASDRYTEYHWTVSIQWFKHLNRILLNFIEFSIWFYLCIIYHSNGKNIGNGQFTTNVFDP